MSGKMIEYNSRPPKTARVSRIIWDELTIKLKQEPIRIWRNGNGIVFGHTTQDGADWGIWFVQTHDNHSAFIPSDILTKAKVK
jgi:hypothetical protein